MTGRPPRSGRKLFAFEAKTKQGVLIHHAGPDFFGVPLPTVESLARGDVPAK